MLHCGINIGSMKELLNSGRPARRSAQPFGQKYAVKEKQKKSDSDSIV